DVDRVLQDRRMASGPTRAFSDLIVPVKTLDDTLGSRFPAPYLLKLDTEGYERDVLLGSSRTLDNTAVVIVEISVAQRFQGSYSFAELVGLLDQHGFRLFDILAVQPLGRAGAINYMDVAFVRKDTAIEFGG